jgi:transcriptional regulator with XRE-family HTH domain
VRRARCAKGWSIEQLSKRSGVPGRLIREMEKGSPTYVPSEANTVLLAEALRLPAGPLLEERERLFDQ